MSVKRYLGMLAVLALSVVVVREARAGSVGVNFVGSKPDSQTLAADAKAGADDAAQSHWNNLTIANTDPNGHGNSGTLSTVTDDAGKTVKGMTVTVTGTDKGAAWPVNGASWGFAGDNLTLVSGYVWPTPEIIIKGIPYAHYKVYVYAGAGSNGGQGSATIAVADGAKGKVDATDTYFYNFGWCGGKFVKSEAKTLAAAKGSASNLIIFTGNTASNITVQWKGTLGGSWTGVSAIQIVEDK